MILVKGPKGTVLNTGDFRFKENMLEHEQLGKHKIDYLFMDNTFATPEEDFPSQQVAYD
jgi:mRNA degradation ribonuclease J1/J2